MILWDFICANKNCDASISDTGVLRDVEEKHGPYICSVCGHTMVKMLNLPTRHVSWSLWQV